MTGDWSDPEADDAEEFEGFEGGNNDDEGGSDVDITVEDDAQNDDAQDLEVLSTETVTETETETETESERRQPPW